MQFAIRTYHGRDQTFLSLHVMCAQVITEGLHQTHDLILSVCVYSVTGLSLSYVCVFVFRFTCWQAGKRPSPVDGQWYPLHNSTTPPKQKGRLSVHLKLPKNKPQWKLQTQLQQKLDAHPELADAADSKERTLSGHNQSALEDPDRRPAFAMDAQQNQSTAVTQQGRQHHS